MPRIPEVRTRMIEAAARLFRRNGYAAVGVARILAESDAPRGSLYHHFPGGKAEIGQAVIDWAGAGVLELIDRSYADATSPEAGDATLIGGVADVFEKAGAQEGCPIGVFLHAGDGRPNDWADRVAAVYGEWARRVARHHERLGSVPEEAKASARSLLVRLQGAWIVSLAERDASAIREVVRQRRSDGIQVW